MKTTISAVIITRNEEKNISECIESLKWADEIVVIDSMSTDKTVEIARKYTDRIYKKEWEGYSKQKNYGILVSNSEWILNIDADELVTDMLRDEIITRTSLKSEICGYYIPRKNYFMGKWIKHGGWYPNYQLRLFRKGSGEFKDVRVHEGVTIVGYTDYLANPLIHHSYNNFDDFVERSNKYSTLAALDLFERNEKINIHHLVIKPLSRFLKMYLVHGGFIDGWRGFVLAVLYSYYVFIRTIKLWELHDKK